MLIAFIFFLSGKCVCEFRDLGIWLLVQVHAYKKKSSPQHNLG